MKLFTQKDQELLTDIVRTGIKMLLITILSLIFSVIPGVVLMTIVCIITSDTLSMYTDCILSLWVISGIAGLFILLVKFSNK